MEMTDRQLRKEMQRSRGLSKLQVQHILSLWEMCVGKHITIRICLVKNVEREREREGEGGDGLQREGEGEIQSLNT